MNTPVFSVDWFSHNIPIWESILTPFKGAQLEALEIGCFEGRATLWLLENILTHPESRITCIDTFNGGTDWTTDDFDWKAVKQHFLDNTAPYKEKVELIEEDSITYLKKREKRADIIYIDASHAWANALIDGVLSHLLIKPQGIIIFDDYLWRGALVHPDVPKGAIDAFISAFANHYNILALGYQAFLQRK